MPRFTRLPSFNSHATRLAIRNLSSIDYSPPNDVMNADKGSRHCVRRYDPGRDDVFGLGDDGPASCSHDDIEITRCQRIFKITAIIRTMSGEQRKIGGQRFLEQEFSSVYIDHQ